MTDWKQQYREDKDASGLTWQEYHARNFIHVSELEDATTTLQQLSEHVDACTREYREMKRELHEVRVLLESDEYDP